MHRAKRRLKFIVSCSRSKTTRIDGQHISCRSSARRYLIILPIARTSRPAISIFSYTWSNSTRRLWNAVYAKVLEWMEDSADRNSSSAVPGLKPHTDRRSTHLLQGFGWEVFNHHSLYSPDLTPSDFSICSYTSSNFCQRDAKMSVTVVPIPGGRVLRHRIQKLILRYEKYLNFGDENVEKYLNTYYNCSNKSFR